MRKFLIIGGTGFIGQAIAKNILERNQGNVCIFSRSESNQHNMKLKFSKFQNSLSFFIGDVQHTNSLTKCIKAYQPNIIIITAAIKRIDVCEEHIEEALSVNVTGLNNVCNIASEEKCVSHVLYTSTDKASSPICTYGNTKALGEKIMLNYSKNFPSKKFCITRYGNVLNSTGSVIPIFNNLIKRNKSLTLRGKDVTRFILDETQAFQTVWDSLFKVEKDIILIPKCQSMYIKDLAEVMIEKSQKDIQINITDLLPFEKKHESLISKHEFRYLCQETEKYYHINPFFSTKDSSNQEYISDQNIMSKQELEKFLSTKGLI